AVTRGQALSSRSSTSSSRHELRPRPPGFLRSRMLAYRLLPTGGGQRSALDDLVHQGRIRWHQRAFVGRREGERIELVAGTDGPRKVQRRVRLALRIKEGKPERGKLPLFEPPS